MNDIPAFPGIEETLSLERFGTYLAWAGGHRNLAVEIYTLNAQISESLYTPLQMLEVALRNRIHQVMSAVAGETWFDQPEHRANPRQADMLAKARQELTGKAENPDSIVAALTFGFWTAMLGKEHENLWQTTLHAIGRRSNGKGLRRKDFAGPLTSLRVLRNRIAHHEPVLHWDLRKHHAAIEEMIGWLSPVAAQWCVSCSRFAQIYPQAGLGLLLPAEA